MKSGLKYAVIFILLLALSLAAYRHLRRPYIEKTYISYTSKKAAALRPLAAKIRPGITDESLIKLFNELKEQDPSLAAIAIADLYGNVRQIVKNDSLVHSGLTLDRLLHDIKTGTTGSAFKGKTEIKTFTEPDTGRTKFYVCSFNTDTIQFISVYVFRPGKALFIRIMLELVLIVSACLMLTAAVAAAGRIRKNSVEKNITGMNNREPAAEHHSEENAETGSKGILSIDESELFASKYTKVSPLPGQGPDKGAAGSLSAQAVLDNRVFTLFKKIYRELSPQAVTLYIRKTDERLSKSYELRGKTFLRVDAPVFESILVSEMPQADKPGAHITDNGMNIKIPLFYNESLNGLIVINLKESETELDISSIREELKGAARSVQEFIVTGNIIIDSETGLYSESHLKTKLGEHIYSSVKNGTEFCLALIDIFRGRDIDAEQKHAIIKILLPAIKKITGGRFELFSTDYRIAVLMEGINRNEVEKLQKLLEKEITRYRIKHAGDKIFRLCPLVRYTFSGDAVSLKDILEETVRKTERAEAEA